MAHSKWFVWHSSEEILSSSVIVWMKLCGVIIFQNNHKYRFDAHKFKVCLSCFDYRHRQKKVFSFTFSGHLHLVINGLIVYFESTNIKLNSFPNAILTNFTYWIELIRIKCAFCSLREHKSKSSFVGIVTVETSLRWSNLFDPLILDKNAIQFLEVI